MFLVYANVSSLESKGLYTRNYINTHISQIKTAVIVYIPSEKALCLKFNDDYNLQSMLIF